MNYISHSACKGSMPRQLAGQSYFNRNNLLATMMRNREAIRYLCAPFGFGKSFLACSYADLVNDFQHTFWLDGQNPCFLRDLDAKTLLPDLLSETNVGDLVVFDDVPAMGTARRNYAWKVFSGLLKASREVIVIATPISDPLAGHEQDCICLWPQDLLYTNRDWEQLYSRGIGHRQDIPSLSPVGRIPLLAEGRGEATLTFLNEHILELDDAQARALSFILFLLQRGTFEDVGVLMGKEIDVSDIDPSRMRPFVEVDERAGDFAVLGFPLPDVLRSFTPYLTSIAQELGADNASEVAMQCGEFLLEQQKADRACKLLLDLCDQHGRSVWLEKNQAALMNLGAFVGAESIYESLRSERWRTIPALYTKSCIRRACIDHDDHVFEKLCSVSSKVDFPLEERLCAATFAYLLALDLQQSADIESSLRSLVSSLKREAQSLNGSAKAQWEFFAKANLTAEELNALASKIYSNNKDALALACCVRKARSEGFNSKDLDELKQQIASVFLDRTPDKGAIMRDENAVAHGREAESANMFRFPGKVLAATFLQREVLAWNLQDEMPEITESELWRRCEIFEDELEVQTTAYARKKVGKIGALSTVINAQEMQRKVLIAESGGAAPSLVANMFGGFEIRLEDRIIDSQSFKRQKARTLLALLVLESGHDLSCDNLAERLWPDSSHYRARHNFYNCLYLIRKALALPGGSCPYFKRIHGVIRLEKGLVKSDVAVMKDLCERLRLSEPDTELYYHILEQIRALYKGVLLPAEVDEPMIIAAREEWRNRIVNALMHASRRLLGVGDNAVTLQLAEQALAYAPAREDCYELLMSVQGRCGQRPAAIQTWIRYRTFLSEELGLDPSSRAAAVYERIINEEA